ncbi:MAG: sigma-70 family RNA polymerase sigma factor [Candidatus Electryonea clarkiae]|nr:sigma-70 family RNA polymerase sigma factor [Candidatus Electryonea clarkiae]MDP8286072.1 sigma-70 family RNA polymerase sigma factor [Candidatus Electryonea clarkiae]
MAPESKKYKDITDEELMAMVQQDDEMAFEELVTRYQHPLTTFVSRFVRPGPHVEDILQEAFIRVWRHRRRYKTVAKFSTWVFTIAGNLAKTELRRLKIRRNVTIRTGGESMEEEGVDVIDEHQDPENDAEREEIRRVVMEEMEKLPKAYRAAVILRDINDKTYDEIAEILRVPVGTIKSRVNRGRTQLKKKLGKLRDPGQSGWEPD